MARSYLYKLFCPSIRPFIVRPYVNPSEIIAEHLPLHPRKLVFLALEVLLPCRPVCLSVGKSVCHDFLQGKGGRLHFHY